MRKLFAVCPQFRCVLFRICHILFYACYYYNATVFILFLNISVYKTPRTHSTNSIKQVVKKKRIAICNNVKAEEVVKNRGKSKIKKINLRKVNFRQIYRTTADIIMFNWIDILLRKEYQQNQTITIVKNHRFNSFK